MQIGVEFNPEVDEVNPLLTVFVLTETDRRPAVFVGTSSDRIGSPEGTQSYYLTASKRLGTSRFSAYASLNYSEWDREFNVPLGIDVSVGERFSIRPMYDGARPHLMFNYVRDRWSVSLLAVDLDQLGVSLSWGF